MFVSSFVSAVNAGDSERLDGLFAADAVIDDWGVLYRGKAEVRAWCRRELIEAGARITITSAQEDDADATMLVNVAGHGLLGPCRFTFTFEDKRIMSMRITPD